MNPSMCGDDPIWVPSYKYCNECDRLAEEFEQARQEAVTAAGDAQEFAGNAENSANSASGSASDAESAKNLAIGARDDAISAKNLAVSAKDDAVSAKDLAVGARDDAVSAKTAAQEAQTAAEAAAESAEDLIGDLATETTLSAMEDETESIVSLLQQIASGNGIMHLKAIGEKQSGEDVEDALDRLDGNPSNADVVIVDEVAYIYDSTNAAWLTLGGGAGSLNGFSFSLGTEDELKITYTDPEDETDTVTITAPTDTTASAIAAAFADLADTWKGAIITNG